MWIQTTSVASAADAVAAMEFVPQGGLANLRADIAVISEHEVEPPALVGAATSWAKATQTASRRGDGISLQLACAVDATLVIVACSGLTGTWVQSDLAALAERQMSKLAG
jgi:hypothetical protein